MLEIKNLVKVYKTKYTKHQALKGVNLNFKKGEFVAILGQSGSGKTTLLNIIGGLDHYTSGDLIIHRKSTKDFSMNDWDQYRNHHIGYVFQNYHLIQHISILSNVEMGMTISGITPQERRKRAGEVLERVGLSNHMNKKPKELSGGQKQRVAIARALANDPDIILADEPTGALDSETSHEVLALIKKISKEKLIIMVTHNEEIATNYATRTIRLSDGEVISDSGASSQSVQHVEEKIVKRTSMSYFSALFLSFNNLKTKIWRTLITAFAGSIGIIGIALVLAIANGFKANVRELERDTFSAFPIQINRFKSIDGLQISFGNITNPLEIDPLSKLFVPYDATARNRHENKLNDDYLDYLGSLNPQDYLSIQYHYGARVLLLSKNEGPVALITPSSVGFSPIFEDDEFTMTQFNLLEGKLPENENEIVVAIDQKNQIDTRVLLAFGFKLDNDINFEEIIGKKINVGRNNDVYYEEQGVFLTINDQVRLNEAYNKGDVLTVVGVIRGKEGGTQATTRGIYHHPRLTNSILTIEETSDVCQLQTAVNYNVRTGQSFDQSLQTKEELLQYFGCDHIPTSILIYPSGSVGKEGIRKHLNKYNKDLETETQILYEDRTDMITNTVGVLVRMISTVLIALAGISLLVSSIMIGIITYVSVLERTNEIGILRALGARKKDIARVFNAETIIIGFAAGLLGIVFAFILSFPTNILLSRMTVELSNVVRMTFYHSIILIVMSVGLTLIAGLIPSYIASTKDPVVALNHHA